MDTLPFLVKCFIGFAVILTLLVLVWSLCAVASEADEKLGLK